MNTVEHLKHFVSFVGLNILLQGVYRVAYACTQVSRPSAESDINEHEQQIVSDLFLQEVYC